MGYDRQYYLNNKENSKKIKERELKISRTYCECGCNEKIRESINRRTNRPWRFLAGHQTRKAGLFEGRKHTEGTKLIMREAKLGKPSLRRIILDKSTLRKLYVEQDLSVLEMSKLTNVGYTAIYNNLKRYGFQIKSYGGKNFIKFRRDIMTGEKQSEETIEKRRIAMTGQKRTEEFKIGARKRRLKIKIPFKDTNIEIAMKIELGKRNLLHYFQQYKAMFGIHQCDFISEKFKLIIECDGNYWHNYPLGTERDIKFNHIARDNGYLVLRFWQKDNGFGILENIQGIGDFVQNCCNRGDISG